MTQPRIPKTTFSEVCRKMSGVTVGARKPSQTTFSVVESGPNTANPQNHIFNPFGVVYDPGVFRGVWPRGALRPLHAFLWFAHVPAALWRSGGGADSCIV